MRILRRSRCKIVYHSDYLTAIHAQNSYRAFDVMRFRKIRDKLLKERLIRRKDILKPSRVSDEEIGKVHTREYLESLKNPMLVGKILNLDYVDIWDDYIFEYFRYTTGGTILAVEYALEHGKPVFNLGGGYHHAHPDRGEGFCLINDVAIAIEKLRESKLLEKVLVIDLDYHQGNGILLYYKNNPAVFTFSMHADNWAEIKKQNNIDIELPSHIKDVEYLEILKEGLPGVFEIFKPELAIYLAGSDPFILDTLADFDISEKGMLERDTFVYRLLKSKKIPVAVLAAGGYGTESWKVYYNFIKWVVQEG